MFILQRLALGGKFSALSYGFVSPTNAASYFELDDTSSPGIVQLKTRQRLEEPFNPSRLNLWNVSEDNFNIWPWFCF